MVMVASERPPKRLDPLRPETGTAAGQLRSRILNAVGWSMLAYVSGYGLRLLASLIMTRLLVPEMFGVMAIATVVQVIASMLCDVGLRQAVIQNKRGDEQIFLDTAWTLQIIRGFAVWLACSACALVIASLASSGWFDGSSAYSAPQLPSIIVAMALSAVILGFQSTKSMSSDRHFNQRQLAIIEFAAQLVGLVIAVIIGYLTRSIWSFVIAHLVATAFTVGLSHWYLPGALNRLRMDPVCAGELLRFGRWILASSLFTVLAANGDRILLAGWIDPATLGLYVLAFNLVIMIEGGGGRLFWSVATPAFSKIANDRPDDIRAVYYRCRLPFDIVFVGCAGLLYGGGDAIIQLLYDDRYAQAGHILQVLSFSLLLTRFGLANSLFLAIGYPQNLSIINGIKTMALFLAVPTAHWLYGFEGALWAIALHGVVILPVIFILNRRHSLNNLGYELATLLLWPAGYLAGLLMSYALQPFHSLF